MKIEIGQFETNVQQLQEEKSKLVKESEKMKIENGQSETNVQQLHEEKSMLVKGLIFCQNTLFCTFSHICTIVHFCSTYIYNFILSLVKV